MMQTFFCARRLRLSIPSNVAYLALLAAMTAAPQAWSAGTAAGTAIDNTAVVNYDLGGTNISQSSNIITVTVDERIDVVVTEQSPQVLVTPGDANRSLLFTLTNTGNGNETFNLTVDSGLLGDDFNPTPAVPAIYYDTDASGDFNPGDIAITAGSNDPTLAADESVNVLLVNDIPGGLLNGNVGLSELIAVSATGTGNPGDSFAGLGDGGVDAVLGATAGTAGDTGEYVVSDVQLSIVKSVVVSDQFGGVEPVPGATLTYSVTIQVTNSGTATGSTFVDAIPINTTYVPASITLDTVGMSDVVDADAGELDTSGAARVVVRLGDLTLGNSPRTVTFQVVID